MPCFCSGQRQALADRRTSRRRRTPGCARLLARFRLCSAVFRGDYGSKGVSASTRLTVLALSLTQRATTPRLPYLPVQVVPVPSPAAKHRRKWGCRSVAPHTLLLLPSPWPSILANTVPGAVHPFLDARCARFGGLLQLYPLAHLIDSMCCTRREPKACSVARHDPRRPPAAAAPRTCRPRSQSIYSAFPRAPSRRPAESCHRVSARRPVRQ